MFRVKVALLSLLKPALVGAIIFVSAGRLDLPGVWGVIGVLLVFCLAMAAVADPGMMRERAKPGGANRDRLTRAVGIPLLLAHWVLAGLDARFGWSPVPSELQFAGVVAYAVAMAGAFWAVTVNPFYSSVVRVQADRGQRVVDAGPYRFVRHPGYAATLAGVLAGGLALGSWLAMVPLVPMLAVFVRRLLLEDRMLRSELPGYAEYATRVRSPGLSGAGGNGTGYRNCAVPAGGSCWNRRAAV